MKRFIIIGSLLILAVFSACEKKENMPWPDDVKYGAIVTLDYAQGQYNGIEIAGLDTFAIKFDIKVENGDCKTLKLMAVHTPLDSVSNFTKQNVVAEYTTSGIYTININEIVNAIPEYNSIADIKFADKLTFFVNVETNDGRTTYAILPFFRDYTSGYDPNILAHPGYNFMVDFVFF